MSLFKAREWWKVNCGEGEWFDQDSLLIAALDPSSEHDVIAVGSHSGVLRIFKPTLEFGSRSNNFLPTDLLLEVIFSQPILRMSAGHLVSGSTLLHLAILHPQSVIVYNLILKQGNTPHGDESCLVRIYEHQLKHSAHSLVVGPFGGARGRDFLCIQALDGTLSFFEQETYIFSCQLPNFLLPTSLVYLTSTDSFVTCTSLWAVESFRYQMLAEYPDTKKIVPDWSLNLGEFIIDIDVCDTHISVLGQHHLFCLHDHGILWFIKRLDFHPLSFYTYKSELSNKQLTLLATDTSSLLILEHSTLKWSTQLPCPAVAVRRASFKESEGVLVILSETGTLQCCYLGTEPSLFVAPAIKPRHIDFAAAEQELVQLNALLQVTGEITDLSLSSSAAQRELQLSASFLESSTGNQTSCKIQIHLEPLTPLSKVQVVLGTTYPIVAVPSTHTLSSLCTSTILESFVTMKNSPISSLQVQVAASYTTNSGSPRAVVVPIDLPLRFAASPSGSAPLKEAAVRITLATSAPAVSLVDLFPEFRSEEGQQGIGQNMASFSLNPNGDLVSILVGKSSPRYRLQADSAIPLAVIAQQLVHRLRHHFVKQKDFKIIVVGGLPLEHLFNEIDEHQGIRKNITDLEEELSQLAGQLRAVQRRLLAKFKDKQPSSLSRLDLLLHRTSSTMVEKSFKIFQMQEALKFSCSRLNCVLRVLALSTRLFDAVQENIADLQKTLSPTVHDNPQQSWEQITETALVWLLGLIAGGSRHLGENQRSTSFATSDTARLKSYISAAMSHVAQISEEETGGTMLIAPIEEMAENETSSPEAVLPIGARLGRGVMSATNSQPRLLSALVSGCFRFEVVGKVTPSYYGRSLSLPLENKYPPPPPEFGPYDVPDSECY